MKHLRVTINVAVTVAMMLPTGIFAECCCSSSKIGCCAVEAPTETPKSKCCSCEQRLAEQESLLECVTLKIENQDRSSCECCLKVRQNSSSIVATPYPAVPRVETADRLHGMPVHFSSRLIRSASGRDQSSAHRLRHYRASLNLS